MGVKGEGGVRGVYKVCTFAASHIAYFHTIIDVPR